MACRTSRDKRALLRVVRTPDGRVVPDASGRLNGRGAYVCPTGDCIDQALTRGGLARALATPVPAALRADLVAATAQIDDRGGTSGTK